MKPPTMKPERFCCDGECCQGRDCPAVDRRVAKAKPEPVDTVVIACQIVIGMVVMACIYAVAMA